MGFQGLEWIAQVERKRIKFKGRKYILRKDMETAHIWVSLGKWAQTRAWFQEHLWSLRQGGLEAGDF